MGYRCGDGASIESRKESARRIQNAGVRVDA